MTYPEHHIIIDESTRVLLAQLSRRRHLTYGEMVEVLVVEHILREALDDDTAAALLSDDAWVKIRERLGHVQGSVDS